MRKLFVLITSVLSAFLLTGCGGSSNNTTTTPSDNSAAETVTISFSGGNLPAVAALQVGTGTFTTVPIQNNQLVLNLPAGVSNYAVAYVCSTASNQEFVIEATKQDDSSFNETCPNPPGASLTANVDASQITGVTLIEVSGRDGESGGIDDPTITSFPVGLPLGTNDVGVIANDTSGQDSVLAVRILRSQTVPGLINGGAPVVLGAADLITAKETHYSERRSGWFYPSPE